MKNFFLILFSCCCTNFMMGQFAPPAGQAGTTAIDKNDSRITSWATSCSVNRGWVNIADVTLGYATVGSSNAALDAALANGVISLGDGGSITCSFYSGIVNGPGYDFAVYENSFQDDFLELAFVEVSSDGIRFVRFPAVSNTQDTIQLDTFGLIDARALNNLAGKYRAGFGTPFDLDELKDSLGLDLNDITYLRVIDVVGSLNPLYASYDMNGHKINDPWPTPYPSSGFDLDAIAVLNARYGVGIKENIEQSAWNISPSVFDEYILIKSDVERSFELIDCLGNRLAILNSNTNFDSSYLASGIYFVGNKHDNSFKKIVKQ